MLRQVISLVLGFTLLASFIVTPAFHRHAHDSPHPDFCYALHPAANAETVTIDSALSDSFGSAPEWNDHQRGIGVVPRPLTSFAPSIPPSGDLAPLPVLLLPVLLATDSTPPRAPPV